MPALSHHDAAAPFVMVIANRHASIAVHLSTVVQLARRGDGD